MVVQDIITGSSGIIGSDLNPIEVGHIHKTDPKMFYVAHFDAISRLLAKRTTIKSKRCLSDLLYFSSFLHSESDLEYKAWAKHLAEAMEIIKQDELNEKVIQFTRASRVPYLGYPLFLIRETDMIRVIKEFVNKRNYSKSTIHCYFKLLLMYLETLSLSVHVPKSTIYSVKKILKKFNPNRDQDFRTYIHKSEMKKLKQYAIDHPYSKHAHASNSNKMRADLESLRNDIALTLLEQYGIRIDEFSSMRVSHFKPATSSRSARLMVTRQKSNAEEFLELSPELSKKIRKYLTIARKICKGRVTGLWVSGQFSKPMKGSGWLSGLIDRIQKRNKDDFPYRFSAHDYRATLITDLYAAEVDINHIASYIGHTTGKATFDYVIRSRIAELVKEEKISPKLLYNIPEHKICI